MYSSIKIKDYKCFVKENDYQGFDDIKPVNVIIGKNNSGKSKLLEALAGIVFLQQYPQVLPIAWQIP